MMSLRIALGMFCGLLSFVGAVALKEHLDPYLGAHWLREILPFGLATQPLWLTLITVGSGTAAWFLLRQLR
jgi:hypothetical protein